MSEATELLRCRNDVRPEGGDSPGVVVVEHTFLQGNGRTRSTLAAYGIEHLDYYTRLAAGPGIDNRVCRVIGTGRVVQWTTCREIINEDWSVARLYEQCLVSLDD